MLSIENPPDPSCSCEISGVKTDERVSDKHALQQPDLLKSGLDDDQQLSNFSIRDYVLTARSKDIQTNWPFPQRYLHLCLKHGIKDLLPPFEPPDSVRNQCFRKLVGSNELGVCVDGSKSVVEFDSLEEENISYLDGESSRPSEQSILGSSDKAPSPLQEQEKLAVISTDTNLCSLIRSPSLDQAGGGGLLSTLTNYAHSERESIPTNRLPCTAQEINTLSEASVGLEVAGPPTASYKTENTIQLSGKKCRLILKLGIISDPSCTDHITLNTPTESESMASKVCPVCKTFSSTSNTTLNAHIDQCLSVESSSKWAVNSKLTKHRLKPRKKRSMVDICATAPQCTLEELDKRNGSNWATDLSSSTRHSEPCTDGKRHRVSRVDLEDTCDESAVYIDSNGTKIRILSKFNDASVPTVGDDSKPRKHMKKSKESKIFSTNKKRSLAPKHPIHLELKPRREKLCSPRSDRAEICGPQEGNYGMEENREESLSELLKAHEEIQPGNTGTLRQWVCSKRTGLLKEFNDKDGHRGREYPPSVTRDPLIESNQSYLGDSCPERSRILKIPHSSENPVSSPKIKRVESSSFKSQIADNRKRSPKLPKGSFNQLSKGSSSFTHDNCMLKLSKSSGNHASSLRSKRVEIHAGPVANSDIFSEATVNPSKSCHLFSSKGKKLPTLGKNMLVVGPSFPRSKFCENEEGSTFEKSRVHSISKIGEQIGALPSQVDERYDPMLSYPENQPESFNQIEVTHKSDSSNNVLWSEMEEIMDGVSIGRSDVLESRQEREAVSSSERKEPLALVCSQSGIQYCGLDPAATIDSPVGISDNFSDKSDVVESASKEAPINEDIVIEPSFRRTVAGPVIRSRKSLLSGVHKLSNPSDTRFNSLPSIDEYERHLSGNGLAIGPTEPSLSDDQKMYYGGEVGNGTIGSNTHTGTEADWSLGGGNCFCEVDTIPIPGPPGSFLPSPRDIGPEVLPENSSLTSSLVLSSQDQHMLVDRDSSISPVSASSTIYHLPTARSDLKYSDLEPSVEPPAAHDMIRSSFSESNSESAIGDVAAFLCTASIGTGRNDLKGDNLKVPMISLIKGPLKFTDDQPCCCSTEVGISHGAALNHQESQLLRQCIMASESLPSKGKQMDCNHNIRREIFSSFNTCPKSRIDKVVVPVLESSTGPISMKASPNVAGKLPSNGQCNSACPSSQAYHPQSTSNPVLRLMGKNLMVVNKEEDASMQHIQPQEVAPNDHPNPQYLTLCGISTSDITSQGRHSFHCAPPKDPVIYGQGPRNPPAHCFRVGISNIFGSHINSEVCQTPTQQPAGNCSDMHMGGFAASSFQPHGFKGRIDLPTQQKRPNHGSNAPLACKVERVIATQHFQNQHATSAAQATSNPIREVIIIEDSPENEADSTMINAKYSEELGRSRQSPGGILTPTALNSNLRRVDAFSCYQSQNPFPLREPLLEPNPSFLLSSPGGANTSPVMWGGTSEGSSALLRRPSMV